MLQYSGQWFKLPPMKAPERPYHHGHLRDALLQAAGEALENGGAQDVSLRELSRRIGVSHTSPRRHFADKQALLDALAVRGFERFDETLARAASRRDGNFTTRLTRIARAYVKFALKHPALIALMFESKYRPDAPRELLEASERAFSRAPAFFAEAQAAGEVVPGDPARLALIVIAALWGLVSISKNGKFKGIPLDHLVGEIIQRLIVGFRPR
jgi:AcrR family transcriptional regulator